MSNKYDELFMSMAEKLAGCSTCARVQVGAVLVKDRRVVSTGWNGVPSGLEHCNTLFDAEDWTDKRKIEHHEFSRKFELHAEQNCLIYAGRSGVHLDGDLSLYVTVSPCSDCAKLIVAAGIKEVVYKTLYDRDPSGIELLKTMGIEVRQI